jgi:uncharacterized membrane protein YfcA
VTLALLVASGVVVGTIGALLGIGGGVLLVPILVFGFGVPIGEAVPVSLVCVVASSSGAAASYVEHGLADVRLALGLEAATVCGAVLGGFAAGLLRPSVLELLFGLLAIGIAIQLVRDQADRSAAEARDYQPTNYGWGTAGAFLAGSVSALLGVGGGPVEVPLMAYTMRVPLKVAAATSNLMIGVTAAASVTAYASRGQLRLNLAAPLVVGVLFGALVGTHLMMRTSNRVLRWLLASVLLLVAARMVWAGGAALWPR